MKQLNAKFIISAEKLSQCPDFVLPEFPLLGRSNVGKSSFINMLTNNGKLAKTSSKPGKTQLINHFIVNNQWYLVDLPGYGYAKIAKNIRESFPKMISDYLQLRPNLVYTCVLIDSRLEPQKIDIDFLIQLGENEIPFVLIFNFMLI